MIVTWAKKITRLVCLCVFGKILGWDHLTHPSLFTMDSTVGPTAIVRWCDHWSHLRSNKLMFLWLDSRKGWWVGWNTLFVPHTLTYLDVGSPFLTPSMCDFIVVHVWPIICHWIKIILLCNTLFRVTISFYFGCLIFWCIYNIVTHVVQIIFGIPSIPVWFEGFFLGEGFVRIPSII